MKDLKKFYKYLDKINDLEYVLGILDWESKMNLPSKNISEVSRLMLEYNMKIFKLKKSIEFGDLILCAINSTMLGDIELRHLKKLYKTYLDLKNVPIQFYKRHLKILEEVSKKYSLAKEQNDASIVIPHLKKMIESTKQLYSYRESKEDIYDLMLEDNEVGMRTKDIDKLFNELKKFLIPFIEKNKILKKSETKYTLDQDKCKAVAVFLLSYIGLDLDKMDINIFDNAFTSRLGVKDVRLTFNISSNLSSLLCTIIHEGGHALVESNISDEYLKYAANSLKSLTALHESQSRFYENILARNINFWRPIYDKIKNILGVDLDLDTFYKHMTSIIPQATRLDSDEVSYCLHIIIRYEIERDLFSGKIEVDDILEVWKKKMKDYLGVEVQNDSDNFLQDVHWFQGSFGYFPSYLLGTIYDGMFLTAIKHELGDIDILLKSGKIKVITDYFAHNIYKYGGAYNSLEYLNKICGQTISTKDIIDYFKNKYNS